MPFEVSVDALFSKMCNHIEKRNGQKAVLSDIIIQGAIVRAIWCEKIRVEDVRCADIYFVFEFLNREWQFNWSIMESGDDGSGPNAMIFASSSRNTRSHYDLSEVVRLNKCIAIDDSNDLQKY